MVQGKDAEMDAVVQLEISRVRGVFGDSRGCYDFLTMECEYYLPAFNFTNLKWMANIWKGECKALNVQDVRPIKLKQIQGLRIKDLVNFLKARGHTKLLPVATRNDKEPKYCQTWLTGVAMSLEPETFKNYFTEKLRERKEKIQAREGLVVITVSDIAQKIMESNLVKRCSGRAASFLSNKPMKRTLLDKAEAQLSRNQQLIKDYEDKVKELEQRLKAEQASGGKQQQFQI